MTVSPTLFEVFKVEACNFYTQNIKKYLLSNYKGLTYGDFHIFYPFKKCENCVKQLK